MPLRLVDSAFSEQSKKTPPVKQPYARDKRNYLTRDEVELLADSAAKLGRYGQRDRLMILVAYWHGLRATELVGLRRTAINLSNSTIAITRAKNGRSTIQPFANKQERKAWLAWLKGTKTEFLFEGERGPLTERAFHKIVSRAAQAAGFAFDVHPHMLRHATGYVLINNGRNLREIQDYLGHRDIGHTTRYTALAENAFDALRDIL